MILSCLIIPLTTLVAETSLPSLWTWQTLAWLCLLQIVIYVRFHCSISFSYDFYICINYIGRANVCYGKWVTCCSCAIWKYGVIGFKRVSDYVYVLSFIHKDLFFCGLMVYLHLAIRCLWILWALVSYKSI